MSRSRPRLVELESRVNPATIVWDGGPSGNGNDWLDASNWDSDNLPGPSDFAVLNATGSSPLIHIGGLAQAQGLFCSRPLVVDLGGSLILGASNSVLQSITLNDGTIDLGSGAVLSGAQIHGQGALTIASGRTVTLFQCESDIPLAIAGTAIVRGQTIAKAAVTVAPTGLVRVVSDSGGAQLELHAGLINQGLIELSNEAGAQQSLLDLRGGLLLNANGATIRTPSSQSGSREIQINSTSTGLNNQGKLHAAGADLAITLSGPGPVVVNSGTMQVDLGQTMTSHLPLQNNGTLIGAGTMRLARLDLSANMTTSNLATLALGGLTGSAQLTNAPGHQLHLLPDAVISAAVFNQGTIVATGTVTILGALAAAPGSVLRIVGNDASGAALFKLAGNVANHGKLELTDEVEAQSATLIISSGAFSNASDGSIIASKGLGGARQIDGLPAAQFVNNGLLQIDTDFAFTSLPLVNTGTISLGAGSALLAGTSVINQSNGRIEGEGTIQSPSLSGSGRLSPGRPIGTLQVTGSVNMDGPLTLELGSAAHDQLQIDGPVVVNGPLELSVTSPLAPGTVLRIVDNDGSDAVGGTFSGLPQGAIVAVGAAKLQVNYKAGTGNDVELTVVGGSPATANVIVGNGTAQRSRITSLQIAFSQTVGLPTVPAEAFQLKRLSDNSLVGLNAAIAGNTVTLTWTSGPVQAGSLIDGRYQLTLLAAQIAAGQFDGNADGTPGDNGTFLFHRLFGDNDGDADVDLADFSAFRQAFGSSSLAFDSDGDGDVDLGDFAAFRGRFGTTI